VRSSEGRGELPAGAKVSLLLYSEEEEKVGGEVEEEVEVGPKANCWRKPPNRLCMSFRFTSFATLDFSFESERRDVLMRALLIWGTGAYGIAAK
jgi:hypothetical protein